MIKKIETNKGLYSYEVKEFILGTKRIDKEISKENLLAFRKCFNEACIPFGLIYGTLLGAVREKDFIEHDEDTDIFVLDIHRKKVLDILFELKEVGLVVGRYEADDDLLSFVKDGEYIDIYFFKDAPFGKMRGSGSVIESKYLKNLVEIEFLGASFCIPQNSEVLLEKIYGHDWMIPKQNVKGVNFGFYLKTKFFIRDNFKTLFKIISWSKKKLNV